MDIKLKNSNVIIHSKKRLNLTATDSKPFFSGLKIGAAFRGGKFSLPAPSSSKKIKREEIYVFANQLAVLLDSGVPMLSALTILVQQTQNAQFKKTIEHIKDDINAGSTLTEALSKFRNIFPNLFISLVLAAEVGGQLPDILKLVSQYLEEQDKLDKKIKSAIVYPRFVFTFFIVLLLGIIFGLVPKFEETFESLGSKLPVATQILLDSSRFAAGHLIIEVVGVIGLFVAYKRFKASERGKWFFDELKLKLPVVGDLILKASLSKFCRTLKILMQSGVPLIESLDIAGETAENRLFTHALKSIKQSVFEGETLSGSMRQFPLFPSMVVEMVATGEESGSLEKMLKNISELYDTHVDSKISGLTSIIEPVMMIALGAVAVVVILALYLPIFNMGSLDF